MMCSWAFSCLRALHLPEGCWGVKGGALDKRRIALMCLWGKGGLNKLTKLIVGHLMTYPMMQWAVFQQRITQKSCDERGPLRACVRNSITLQKFPCLIPPPPFNTHPFSDVQTIFTHSPLMNALNGQSHTAAALDHASACLCLGLETTQHSGGTWDGSSLENKGSPEGLY